MENIILQIIKKYFSFSPNMNFFEMTKMLYKNSDKFTLEILKFLLEEIDSSIKNSKERKRS